MTESAPDKKPAAPQTKSTSTQKAVRSGLKSEATTQLAKASAKQSRKTAKSPPPRGSKPSSKPAKRKTWTIMVYMAGDNNLSEDMITGLKGMMSFGPSDDVNLIAVFDGSHPSLPVQFYDFTKPRNSGATYDRLKHFADPYEPPIPSSHNPKNLSLKRFVRKVFKNYDSLHYALIISAHSDGVLGRTLMRDEDPRQSLEIRKLRRILKDALPKDRDGDTRKLDLLGFDGCLMGMVEVGCELKGVTKVLVASEGNVPTAGWPYDAALKRLKSNCRLNEKELAESLVSGFSDFMADYSVGGRSVNISACDLRNLYTELSVNDLIQRIGEFLYDILKLPVEADKALKISEADAMRNLIAREKFIECISVARLRSQSFMHSQAVDLIDFLSLLFLSHRKWARELEQMGVQQKKGQPDAINAISDQIATLRGLSKALIESVYRPKNVSKSASVIPYIIKSCTNGFEYQFSYGVSIFFPWTEVAFEMLIKSYDRLKFNDGSANRYWLRFIRTFARITVRKRPPKGITVIIDDLEYPDLSKREVGGKEVGGKEVGGKGGIEEFYRYFDQISNFDSQYLDQNCADGPLYR